MAEETKRQAPAVVVPARTTGHPVSGDKSERRILTALCYDLVGSTDLLAILDIEDFQELLSAFGHAARRAIATFAGSVMNEAGDGGLAVFPTTIGAQDAASLAIRAGFEIVEACKRVGSQHGQADLHVRVGIATSMSLIQERHPQTVPGGVTSSALALCTRLQGMAKPDTVFVSNETRRLARRSHVFSFQGSQKIKGFDQPEQVWQALRRRREVDRFFSFGRLSSPLLGRSEEIQTIAEVWKNAATGRGGIVVIEGEGGIGKSRILHEVRRTTRDSRSKLLPFQCLPGGMQSALHPLLNSFSTDAIASGPPTIAMVAALFQRQGVLDPEITDIFAYLLGAGHTNQSTLEMSPDTVRDKASRAVQNALRIISSKGPILLTVEDIHWLDPTSRKLLTDVGDAIVNLPALLIATTRDVAGIPWPTEQITHIKLRPLDRQETRQAIEAMWPDSRSPDTSEILEVLTRVSGGVPLFVEEICQWMSENSSFSTDSLAQTASPNRTSIFENILESRLLSLGPARDVAHAASVVGSRFDRKVLGALLPGLEAESISHALEVLNAVGLLSRIRPSSLPSYGFRHSLIQETIYNALLRKSRQTFHQRLFTAANRDQNLAPWIGTAALAEHAERAGAIESAIELLVKAGTDSYGRSAMAEARQLLEHALDLCELIGEPVKQDPLRLTAMTALGPVLTVTEGPNSAPARKLYEDGVEIARRRPSEERAKWFPIYWGWWFTDTVMDGERAHALLRDLKDVEDVEVQFQARHCVWAIDFYLGRHESCIAAVDTGLSHYGSLNGREKFAFFGGHDAHVCGLSHRGLSQWFTGKPASALQSLSKARHWAHRTGHVGSIAHAYNNEAMLHCYRRDKTSLRKVLSDIRRLTDNHHLTSLSATATILEGWCEGDADASKQGTKKVREGLIIHGQLQTPEDYPVYCTLLAELLAKAGDFDEALDLLSSAAMQAGQSGHRYWLAELHNRRARIFCQNGSPEIEIVGALAESLSLSSEQNAVPMLLGAYDLLVSVDPTNELVSRYGARCERARAALEPGEDLIVNPEPIAYTRTGM